jgi:hypothetical protein
MKFLVILCAAALTGCFDYNPKEDALYCEMVSIYKASNGQYGWPAYKGVTCEPDLLSK